MLRFTLLICFIGLTFSSSGQFYNGSQQDYGKSRVQYRKFKWKVYKFQQFDVYFYDQGTEMASYIAQKAHQDIQKIERLFDYEFGSKIEIICYNSLTDFKQSNIGITGEETQVGGKTQIIGSKLFIYYEGTHEQLNEQLASSLMEVFLNKMMWGGSWKDVLKANLLMDYPEWFIKGFLSYIGKDWDTELEAKIKDGILTGRFKRFNDLEGEDAALAGHAIWKYVEDNYGKEMIPNIIYLSKVSKNIDRAFKFSIGVGIAKLSYLYLKYYEDIFWSDVANQEEMKGEQILIKSKKNHHYYQVKLSPDGEQLAYVDNIDGKYGIYVYDFFSGKRTKVYGAESKIARLQDRTFPVIEWHPSGDYLSFYNERKGKIWYHLVDLKTKEHTKVQITKLEKVMSYSFSHDGKRIVLSGVWHGQTDIYIYNIVGNSIKKLTDDIWDDVDPRFVDNSSKVIFSSNRDTTYINMLKKPENKPFQRRMDLYLMDLKEEDQQVKILEQLTNTPLVNERQAYQIGTKSYVYLSNANGVVNRHIAYKDSVISHIDTIIHYRYLLNNGAMTNYVTNILEQDVRFKVGKSINLYFQNNKYKFYLEDFSPKDSLKELSDTYYMRALKRDNKKLVQTDPNNTLELKNPIKNDDPKNVKNDNPDVKRDPSVIDIYDYTFLDEGGNGNQDGQTYEKKVIILREDNGNKGNNENQVIASEVDTTKQKNRSGFQPPHESLYKMNFAKDYVVTQLNNDFLSQTYQRYSGPGAIYFNSGFSALFKIGFSDLFEDVKLIGGMRIPVNFNSSEFLVGMELLANRLDHKIILYRSSYKSIESVSGDYIKWKTHEVRYRMSYPFTETFSIRGTFNYRNDHKVYLSYDDISIGQLPENTSQAGAKFELVFDNSKPIQLNIWEGAKLKVFGEYLQSFSSGFKAMYNLGFDFRHSLKIHRNLIWVNRLSFATSWGQNRILYYLGAVDGWWQYNDDKRFDKTIEVDPSQPYAYQAIGTPMRGFKQNVRNGNSFVALNSELRWPIFSYFSKYPVKSDFLKNFQIVIFGDIGTAWTGPHPYSDDNYFNKQTIYQKPLTIEVFNAREPIVGGFGFGARAKLFGYFLRFDLGWGVENGVIGKPIPYFTLSTDI
ncbi:MAG: PD40 domain-containing protein [Crocinitomicaceae bacterium]|nr:PD40 domain-containing protein [Crocinitomicaceae bacterium]